MSRDPELETLREKVDCRTLLERDGWTTDAPRPNAISTKYRKDGAIIVVVHTSKGWFDPLSDRKGDVISLAQHLWGLNIGQVRRELRPLAGIQPSYATSSADTRPPTPLDATRAWTRATRLLPGSDGWSYLTVARGLPADTLRRANTADLLRAGILGTVWFKHRTLDGTPTGWEMRGPGYQAFSKGGSKVLFWIANPLTATRIAITESAIDALSLATIERWPDHTAYVSTGGGFGPLAAETLRAMVSNGPQLVAATDNDAGGHLIAERLHKLAVEADATFDRLLPTAKDWNAQLAEDDMAKIATRYCAD
jgi:hypothetical protein